MVTSYIKLNSLQHTYMESHDVGFFLPGWMQRNENVVLTSPHDDDVLFGCGLMLQILKEEGAEIYVAVMTNGDKGYCNEERLGKNNIVEARKEATFRAYDEIGIDANHLIRFEYPDSELAFHIDWKLISRMIEFYRNVDATRLFVPNENDFHIDHKVSFNPVGIYCGIQASTSILPDLGEPCNIKTILRYPVWMDFAGSPSHIVTTDMEKQKRKIQSIGCYRKVQPQMAETIREIEERGPKEYFQEYKIEMFSAREIDEMFEEKYHVE